MLPEPLKAAVEAALSAPVTGARRASGGSICQAFVLDLDGGGRVFLKTHEAPPPRFFLREAAGLAALRAATKLLTVPAVLHTCEALGEAPAFLILEALEEGRASPESDRSLGRGLAELHRAAAPAFGFEDDNFIGSAPQENGWIDDWPRFFAERRLRPPFEAVAARGDFDARQREDFERLLRRLPELIATDEAPSLVHGDLWSGNILALKGGGAAIIDPATHYAHREVDLAMTELFGRQGSGFYEAYDEAFPRAPGYEERRELYNLYHLLNHARLFGGSYIGQSASLIARFSG